MRRKSGTGWCVCERMVGADVYNGKDLTSALELEFETHFCRFLMPTIRGAGYWRKTLRGLIPGRRRQRMVFGSGNGAGPTGRRWRSAFSRAVSACFSQ